MTSTRMRSMRSWGFSACANWRSRSLSPLPAPSLAFHLGVSLHFRPLSTASLSLNRRGGGTAGGGGLLPPPANLAPLLLLCLSLRIEDAAAQAETKALWMHTMALMSASSICPSPSTVKRTFSNSPPAHARKDANTHMCVCVCARAHTQTQYTREKPSQRPSLCRLCAFQACT